ncbi:MAG: hypothetical protein ACWA47_04210 [Brevirhabdus sp.]
MTRPTISLHVGAHKTATSHLQRSLQRNRPALRSVGARFFPTNKYRREIAPFHAALRNGTPLAELRAELDPMLANAAQGMDRLILSDENILGQLPRVARDARLYPWGREGAQRAVRLLGDREVELFLSIRNPVGFLQSAYSESLLHGPFQPFERFLSPFNPGSLRWSRLIEELMRATGVLRITVWRFEDYPRLRQKVVETLTGAPLPKGFEFLDKRPRPGLSARALEQLSRWHDDGRNIRDEALIGHAAGLFPKGSDWPAPQNFDPETNDRITAQYEADCQIIAGMTGVRLLSPVQS